MSIILIDSCNDRDAELLRSAILRAMAQSILGRDWEKLDKAVVLNALDAFIPQSIKILMQTGNGNNSTAQGMRRSVKHAYSSVKRHLH